MAKWLSQRHHLCQLNAIRTLSIITCQIAATLAPASLSFDPLPTLPQLLPLLLTQVEGVEPLEDASPEQNNQPLWPGAQVSMNDLTQQCEEKKHVISMHFIQLLVTEHCIESRWPRTTWPPSPPSSDSALFPPVGPSPQIQRSKAQTYIQDLFKCCQSLQIQFVFSNITMTVRWKSFTMQVWNLKC